MRVYEPNQPPQHIHHEYALHSDTRPCTLTQVRDMASILGGGTDAVQVSYTPSTQSIDNGWYAGMAPQPEEGTVQLRVFVDRSIVEVYTVRYSTHTHTRTCVDISYSRTGQLVSSYNVRRSLMTWV
jgi:hypothetical protein